MQKIEKRFEHEGREIRWTNFIDEDSLAFEKESQDLLRHSNIDQTLVYLLHINRPFFVFQMRGIDKKPAAQICVTIAHPPGWEMFSMATVSHLHPFKKQEDEEIALTLLRKLAKDAPGVMSLRIQPKRYQYEDIQRLQERSKPYGYRKAAPMDFIRTLLVDLKATSTDELLTKLGQKTRAKIRSASREKITLKRLYGKQWVNSCKDAVSASVQRTQGDVALFDFDTAFTLADTHPDRAIIVGIFLNHRPNELLAYVIAYANGTRAELVSAGSVGDAELRALPFNYFLLWEVMTWAHSQGCTQFDLGGVTSGEPGDPLQGISRFKRSITRHEVETGAELVTLVKPFRYLTYRALKALKTAIRSRGQKPALSPPTQTIEAVPSHA